MHIAQQCLHEYTRRSFNIWECIARVVYEAKQKHTWPSWCWCPTDIIYEGIYQAAISDQMPETSLRALAGTYTGLGAWRTTQGVYRFHPRLLEQLIDTPVQGALPAEVLVRLPEWCVYVEMVSPDIEPSMRLFMEETGRENVIVGFWAFVTWDRKTNEKILTLILPVSDEYVKQNAGMTIAGLFPIELRLVGTLEDSLEAISYKTMRDIGYEIKPMLSRMLSLLLWLCSEAPEIDDLRTMQPPAVVMTKKRPLIPAAKSVQVYPTGFRIGAKLDFALQMGTESEGSRASGVLPHVRRAHWHHYWTGPRDGARKAIVKWLSPILVGLEAEPKVATIRPVE